MCRKVTFRFTIYPRLDPLEPARGTSRKQQAFHIQISRVHCLLRNRRVSWCLQSVTIFAAGVQITNMLSLPLSIHLLDRLLDFGVTFSSWPYWTKIWKTDFSPPPKCSVKRSMVPSILGWFSGSCGKLGLRTLAFDVTFFSCEVSGPPLSLAQGITSYRTSLIGWWNLSFLGGCGCRWFCFWHFPKIFPKISTLENRLRTWQV